MVADAPFRWLEPSTWPWFVYVWILFAVAEWVRPAWRWLQRRRVQSWPTAEGRIESVKTTSAKRWFDNSVVYRAEVGYSYSVEGRSYSSRLRRSFSTETEASEFIRELRGKAVDVSFNPHKHHSSTLSEISLRKLLENRTPPGDDTVLPASANAIPAWLRPLLWSLAALSAVGFVLSLWVHVNALAGHKPSAWFWGLHVGVFVVFFPAAFVAQKQVGNLKRRDFWKVVLAGAPEWVRYLLYAIFSYVLLNWLLALKGDGLVGNEDWRGFSVTWMAFYSASLGILYSAASTVGRLPRCLNGHVASPNAAFCGRCGQPVVRQR